MRIKHLTHVKCLEQSMAYWKHYKNICFITITRILIVVKVVVHIRKKCFLEITDFDQYFLLVSQE